MRLRAVGSRIGPPAEKRVAGRAGRAGDDEPVGDERREVALVDRDVEADDPGQGSPGDDDVVEGDVDLGPVAARRGAQDPALEGHPVLERVLAGAQAIERPDEVAGLDLREEADLADVDPEQRDVDVGDGPGGPQERAVAAEDDEDVRPGQLAGEDLVVRRGRRPVVEAAHRRPAGGPLAQLEGGLDGRVVGEADAPDARRSSQPPRAARSPVTMSSAMPPDRVAPDSKVQQELPIALRTEDRRRDDVLRRQARRARQPRRRPRSSSDGRPDRGRRRPGPGPGPPRTAA